MAIYGRITVKHYHDGWRNTRHFGFVGVMVGSSRSKLSWWPSCFLTFEVDEIGSKDLNSDATYVGIVEKQAFGSP